MNSIQKYIDYLKDNPKGYWFKRKLFGWGWTPATWQGWLVTLVFAGLIVWNAARIDALSHSASDTLMNFVPQTIALLIVFLVILWRTGEPPAWQWGTPKKDTQQK